MPVNPSASDGDFSKPTPRTVTKLDAETKAIASRYYTSVVSIVINRTVGGELKTTIRMWKHSGLEERPYYTKNMQMDAGPPRNSEEFKPTVWEGKIEFEESCATRPLRSLCAVTICHIQFFFQLNRGAFIISNQFTQPQK